MGEYTGDQHPDLSQCTVCGGNSWVDWRLIPKNIVGKERQKLRKHLTHVETKCENCGNVRTMDEEETKHVTHPHGSWYRGKFNQYGG